MNDADYIVLHVLFPKHIFSLSYNNSWNLISLIILSPATRAFLFLSDSLSIFNIYGRPKKERLPVYLWQLDLLLPLGVCA